MKVMLVGANTVSQNLGMEVAVALKEQPMVVLQSIGVAALAKAVEGIQRASEVSGRDVWAEPKFLNVDVEGKEMTAIQLVAQYADSQVLKQLPRRSQMDRLPIRKQTTQDVSSYLMLALGSGNLSPTLITAPDKAELNTAIKGTAAAANFSSEYRCEIRLSLHLLDGHGYAISFIPFRR